MPVGGGGYDESAESPSGFLIFPTVAVISRSRSQTPLHLARDPLAWTHNRSRPFAVNSKTDQGSRAGLGTAWSLCPPASSFKKEHCRPSIPPVCLVSPPYTLMVPPHDLASPVNTQSLSRPPNRTTMYVVYFLSTRGPDLSSELIN